MKFLKLLVDYEFNCIVVFCSNLIVNFMFVDILWFIKGGIKDMIVFLGNWLEIKMIEEKRKFLKE